MSESLITSLNFADERQVVEYLGWDTSGGQPTHLQWLVQIPHVLRFYIGMLFACSYQFRKCSKQSLYSDATHIHELTGHQGCINQFRLQD